MMKLYCTAWQVSISHQGIHYILRVMTTAQPMRQSSGLQLVDSSKCMEEIPSEAGQSQLRVNI